MDIVIVIIAFYLFQVAHSALQNIELPFKSYLVVVLHVFCVSLLCFQWFEKYILRIIFLRFGNLHAAHSHALYFWGSGACSPEQIFLNDANWCVLVYILIRF